MGSGTKLTPTETYYDEIFVLFSIFSNINKTPMSQDIIKYVSLYASLVISGNSFLGKKFVGNVYLFLIPYQSFIKIKKQGIQASRDNSERNTFSILVGLLVPTLQSRFTHFL